MASNSSRPPEEIVFHRYFQKLRLDLRRRFRGKQDLEDPKMEPGLSSLLANIQDVFNKDLQQQNPSFYFDYIESSETNALAFADEGYIFVAITMPLIRKLWHISEQLSYEQAVREILKVEPGIPEPWAIQAFLFATQLSFVIAHEFAHHKRGHLPSPLELHLELSHQTGSIKLQAQEVDADGLATYMVLSHLITGFRRDHSRALLTLNFTESELDEILLCSFVISVATVFAIFPAVVFDQHTLFRLAYPPQAIRMDRLMLNAMTWCNQNRPALGSVIKPEWFRRILFASLQNAADDWSGQVLRLPLNEVYFSQLNAELVQLLERK